MARKPNGGLGVWLPSNWFVGGVSSQNMGETGEKLGSTQLNHTVLETRLLAKWGQGTG